MYWGQRARLKWLSFGERNSKFFHITTVQRRDRNRLSRLKNKNGDWVEGQKEIMIAIEDYFKEIYSDSVPDIEYDCMDVIRSIVFQAINESLMKDIVEGEVKQAVFSLGAQKASGPDGLNGVFFQKKPGRLFMWKL